jgi:hypothetical protein
MEGQLTVRACELGAGHGKRGCGVRRYTIGVLMLSSPTVTASDAGAMIRVEIL